VPSGLFILLNKKLIAARSNFIEEMRNDVLAFIDVAALI
jgi:hypothetical protein